VSSEKDYLLMKGIVP